MCRGWRASRVSPRTNENTVGQANRVTPERLRFDLTLRLSLDEQVGLVARHIHLEVAIEQDLEHFVKGERAQVVDLDAVAAHRILYRPGLTDDVGQVFTHVDAGI